MNINISEWAVLLCFCAFGIQSSLSFIQSMREIEQNCARDGGFCINIHVPQPPKRRGNANRGRGGAGARGTGAAAAGPTRTRKGNRPDPRALGSQHTRLPASAQAAGGAAANPAAAAANPPIGADPTAQTAPANSGFLFGSNPNDPFNMFGMFSLFTRKKRQAPGMIDPADIAEIPRRRAGQSMYSYLNAHCRKSEMDFGCRQTGGMCCLPFLK